MMKRNIKMIGFDLDGTLLNSNKEISDYTRDVMREAVKQGVIILPATGRPLTGIPKPGLWHFLASDMQSQLTVPE